MNFDFIDIASLLKIADKENLYIQLIKQFNKDLKLNILKFDKWIVESQREVMEKQFE